MVRSLNLTRQNVDGTWADLTDFRRVAAGGGPGTPSGTPGTGLPFAVPSNLDTYQRKYFSLYFMPFSVSINNTNPDTYWLNKWLTGAELDGGTNWRTVGGYVRDHPYWRGPLAGTSDEWKLADAEAELAMAVEAGLDGWINNIFSTSPAATNENNKRYELARQAANSVAPGFSVLPLIDLNGSINGSSVSAIADLLAAYAYVSPVRGQTTGNTWLDSAYRMTDGKFVVAAFKPELKTVTWWQSLFNELQTQYGITATLWGMFLSWSQAANYTSVMSIACPWGDGGDPVKVGSSVGEAASVRSWGRSWAQPVWGGDERPYSNVGDEPLGTSAWRGYLTSMVTTGAELAWDVWSDTREGFPTRPGARAGRCLGDLRLYWMIRWKTGAYPAILRDTIYLAHRNSFVGTPLGSFRSGQSQRMAQWNRGGAMSPATDDVEVLTFLTAPADLTVTIGGNVHTFTAPAGVSISRLPLAYGTISAVAERSAVEVASVTSPFPVTATPFNDRWNPFIVSSARGTSEQYDMDAALS